MQTFFFLKLSQCEEQFRFLRQKYIEAMKQRVKENLTKGLHFRRCTIYIIHKDNMGWFYLIRFIYMVNHIAKVLLGFHLDLAGLKYFLCCIIYECIWQFNPQAWL